MWIDPKHWRRPILSAGLALGVAMFCGCGDSDTDDPDAPQANHDGDRTGGPATGIDDHDTDPDPGDHTPPPPGQDVVDPPTPHVPAPVSIDHSSPAALFDSMLDAARAQNYKAVAECYAPAIQRDMAIVMISTAAMADIDPLVKKEDLLVVLERHGILEDDLPTVGTEMRVQTLALVDGLDNLPAFLGDMMAAMPDSAQGLAGAFADNAVATTKITDVQIEGDNATAQITAGGQSPGEQPRVKFVRIDGLWYVAG